MEIKTQAGGQMKKFSNNATRIAMNYFESVDLLVDQVIGMAQESYEDARFVQSKTANREEKAIGLLVPRLKEYFLEGRPDLLDTAFDELLQDSLDSIQWNEIANYLIDNVVEEVNA